MSKRPTFHYAIDSSPFCNVALGICKACNARFLSTTADGARARLEQHRQLIHKEMQPMKARKLSTD